MEPEAAHEGLLVVTSHGNWDLFSAERMWAFDRSSRLERAREGAEAIVYLTRDGGISSFGGLVKFGPRRTSDNRRGGGPFNLYPHHVPIEVLANLRSPLSVAQFLGRLAFLPNTPHYGARLQGQPIKLIPAEDFALLRKAVTGAPSYSLAPS